MLDLFLYHLTLCLPLFLLVLLGWALAYFKAFSAECSRHLSDFTFRFLMPVMLFDLLSDLSDMPPVDWRALVAFFTSCFFVHLLGRGLGNRFHLDNTGKTVFGMAAIFGNNVQLGVPIVQVSLGESAMPTISLLIIFSVLILWTAAIACVEFGKGEGPVNVRKILLSMARVVKNPIVLGILLGGAYGLTGLKLPGFVDGTLAYISQATTPIALIVVGMGLAQHRFSAALPKGLGIAGLKLIAQPVIVYGLCWAIGLSEEVTQAAVLTAALPVAINIYMMAVDFRSEEAAASNAIFVSTILSAISIPIVLTLMGVANPIS